MLHFGARCLFPGEILLPKDSGANLLSAGMESQEPLVLVWVWHVIAGRGFLPGFLLIQGFLGFFICKACALGKESYRLWLRPEWVQSKAELVEVVQNLLYLRQDPKSSLKPAVEKSDGPNQWVWHGRKQKKLLLWDLLFRDKIPLISTKEQNPGSPQDWASPTRHHLKAEDCRGFDTSAEAQNRANVSAGLLN